MADAKEKKTSKVFEISDVRNMLVKGVQKVSSIQKDVIGDGKNILSQKHASNLTQTKEVCATSHTEADLNWASIVNKATIPNMVKGGLTFGGGSLGSLVGAGLCTGLGLAIGGPAGAAAGYGIGNLLGFGAGAVGGHKFGKVVANELEDRERKNIVEKGITNLNVDSITKVDVEERVHRDEIH